jgi:COQ9
MAAAASEDSSYSLAVVNTLRPIHLVHYAMESWNVQLQEELRQQRDDLIASSPSHHDFVDNLVQAMRLRLSFEIPFRKSWPRAMVIGSLHEVVPSIINVSSLPALLRDTIDIIVEDAILRHSDPSLMVQDTHRWGLGIIYVLAELHLLGSNDQEATWHFLQSRIKEWDQMRHCSLPGASQEHYRDWLSTLVSSLSSSIPPAGNSGADNSAVRNSDAWIVASTLAASLTGGLRSVLQQPPLQQSLFPGWELARAAVNGMNSVLEKQFRSSNSKANDGSAGRDLSRIPGTHPSDY